MAADIALGIWNLAEDTFIALDNRGYWVPWDRVGRCAFVLWMAQRKDIESRANFH